MGRIVHPSPATHAILAQLKAGETVYQTGELPKTLRVSKIDYEPPKTVCKTTFASIFPPSMHLGGGGRFYLLDSESQRAHFAGQIGDFAKHIIIELGTTQLVSNLVDVIFVLPTPATHASLTPLKAGETP